MNQETFDKTLLKLDETKDITKINDVKGKLIELAQFVQFYENSKDENPKKNINIMTSLCGWLLSNYLHNNKYDDTIEVLDMLHFIISNDHFLIHKDKRSILRDIQAHKIKIATVKQKRLDIDEELVKEVLNMFAELAPKVLKGSGNIPLSPAPHFKPDPPSADPPVRTGILFIQTHAVILEDKLVEIPMETEYISAVRDGVCNFLNAEISNDIDNAIKNHFEDTGNISGIELQEI